MSAAQQNRGALRLCAWAFEYAIRRKGALAGVVASLLAKTGVEILKPWPMVFLVDYVLTHKPMSPELSRALGFLPGTSTPGGLILWSAFSTVLLFLLSWAAGLWNTMAGISLGQRMVYDLAADLFARLQSLSLRFHTSKSVGDNIRRVTADCASVSVIIKDALVPVVASTVALVIMFVILWRIDPGLTLLSLAVVPMMALAFRVYAAPMMERSYEQQEIESRIYEVTEQTFSAMAVVQAFGREELNDARFRGTLSATLSATLATTRVQMNFKFLIGLATALGTAAILWLGAQHALAGRLTVGNIILFLSYLASLYAPLEAIMYSSSTLQGAAGSAWRVWEIFETVQEVKDKPGAKPLGRVRGHVAFENVTFGYEKDRPVLQGITLEVKPGETLALVGHSGAGKSSLVSLLTRFFDPWSGRILLDGREIGDAQLTSLRSQVALVLQEPFLFPQTIAENIAYGRPEASRTEIEAAAKAANAHEFIMALPMGYETVIGERGASLSGGERQRVSIARALLKDAPILILDEPTSALDAQTERALMEAVTRLMAQRTTFIIAHRLSTIRHANRIVVLKEGSIAETGTHAELLAKNGVYADFCRLQFGAHLTGSEHPKNNS
jgi:ATP-binding cassette subfamily B protein/subfamily B ATP-binding cassette protein MsbA